MIAQHISQNSSTGASRWTVPGICVVLAAITFVVFAQTLGHEFVDYDDNAYVYDNPVVARGLTLNGLVWAFRGVHAHNWHPLTWLSHELDCQLYGLRSGGHHLTSILLHIATVIMLFLVLRQMTGALWRSAFVAAVFAIHPLHVESVAWVAERKDVLSGLFFILTIAAYVRYARRPGSWPAYGLVMLLFTLGLMCKPMLVTVPLVLLLLDYWPLQRLEPARRLVLEKLPLLALSAALAVVTLVAQKGAIQSAALFPLPSRAANALVICAIYLGQMFYPAGLAVLYPYPLTGRPGWEMAVAGMLWAGISLFAFMQRRKRPWAAVGWAWYLVMLVPVLGIIQVGPQAHADRYTYLPQIGIYLGVTWLIAERRISRWWVAVLMISVAGVLTMCARNQAAYWKNSETLWTHTIACTTSNAIAHNNLGNALLQKGRVDEAITHFQEVLRIKPDDAKADFNLGNALLQKGNVDEAITRYQTALRIEPDFAGAHCSLGNAFRQQGKIDQSITQYREALRINPDYAQGHLGLGLALEQEGRFDAAAVHFQKTLQFDPANEDACVDLGDIFLQEGKVDAAISHYKSALQIKPDYALAHNNVANALLQKGNIDEAISYFQKALNIEPANARIHSNLGNAFLQKGNAANAIGQFRQALQLEPDNVAAQNNLAWLLATCPEAPLRNGNQAVELASRANQLAGGANAVILRTLAASYADAGRFSDAVETAQRALRLAGAQSKTGLAEQIQTELKLYQAGKPFHLPASTH